MPDMEQGKAFTREMVDAMVAEALSSFPDASIDTELANDLELAQEVSALSDKMTPMLHRTIENMVESMRAGGALRLTEIGLAVLAPEIEKCIYPPIPVVAAAYAVAATGLMGVKYIKEEDITPETLDVSKFVEYAKENLHDVMHFLLAQPKKRFLEILIFFLSGHLKSLDNPGAAA